MMHGPMNIKLKLLKRTIITDSFTSLHCWCERQQNASTLHGMWRNIFNFSDLQNNFGLRSGQHSS